MAAGERAHAGAAALDRRYGRSAALTKCARWLVAACVIAGMACGGPLPDDLPLLIGMMESSDVTESINATVKVWRDFGKEGLFEAIRRGGPRARGRAAFRLQSCDQQDCEAILIQLLSRDADGFVRQQAATSLRVVGTAKALTTLDLTSKDGDARVAALSQEAATAIRARLAARSELLPVREGAHPGELGDGDPVERDPRTS